MIPGRRVARREDDYVRAQGRTVLENDGATVRPVLLDSCWCDQVDLTFIDQSVKSVPTWDTFVIRTYGPKYRMSMAQRGTFWDTGCFKLREINEAGSMEAQKTYCTSSHRVPHARNDFAPNPRLVKEPSNRSMLGTNSLVRAHLLEPCIQLYMGRKDR